MRSPIRTCARWRFSTVTVGRASTVLSVTSSSICRKMATSFVTTPILAVGSGWPCATGYSDAALAVEGVGVVTGVGVVPRVVRSLRRTASKAPMGPPTTLAKSTFPTTEMSRPKAVSSVRSTVRMVASTRTCLGGVSSSSMSLAARATFSP